MLLLTMNPRVWAWVSQAYAGTSGTFYLSALERFTKLTLYTEILARIYSPQTKADRVDGVSGANITVFCQKRN
jgi:hypothetical protein